LAVPRSMARSLENAPKILSIIMTPHFSIQVSARIIFNIHV
jgi:hypothetical protein